MFTIPDAREALNTQARAAVAEAEEEGRRYGEMWRPWFEGLAACLAPMELRLLTTTPQTIPNATAAWSWLFSLRPAANVDVPLATFEFRFFTNRNGKVCTGIAFNLNPDVVPMGWTATQAWDKIQAYANETLEESGDFQAYTGSCIYVAP